MCQEFDVNPMLGMIEVTQLKKIYGLNLVSAIFTTNSPWQFSTYAQKLDTKTEESCASTIFSRPTTKDKKIKLAGIT